MACATFVANRFESSVKHSHLSRDIPVRVEICFKHRSQTDINQRRFSRQSSFHRMMLDGHSLVQVQTIRRFVDAVVEGDSTAAR